MLLSKPLVRTNLHCHVAALFNNIHIFLVDFVLHLHVLLDILVVMIVLLTHSPPLRLVVPAHISHFHALHDHRPRARLIYLSLASNGPYRLVSLKRHYIMAGRVDPKPGAFAANDLPG